MPNIFWLDKLKEESSGQNTKAKPANPNTAPIITRVRIGLPKKIAPKMTFKMMIKENMIATNPLVK
jgi:hypothetical protein